MKFSDLLEDLLNEGKHFTDDKYNRYIENAGWWLFDLFQNFPSDITTMPGYAEYREFVLNNSKYSREELKTFDDLVYTLPDYYGYWLNVMAKNPDSLMGRTIKLYNLQDKVSGKDLSTPKKRGRKPKAQSAEPNEPEVADDVMAHLDQAVEKKRRGRPALPPELRKPKKKYNYYVPTGKKSPGRPRKVVDVPQPELTSEPIIQQEPKKRGRPNISKFEPNVLILESKH